MFRQASGWRRLGKKSRKQRNSNFNSMINTYSYLCFYILDFYKSYIDLRGQIAIVFCSKGPFIKTVLLKNFLRKKKQGGKVVPSGIANSSSCGVNIS